MEQGWGLAGPEQSLTPSLEPPHMLLVLGGARGLPILQNECGLPGSNPPLAHILHKNVKLDPITSRAGTLDQSGFYQRRRSDRLVVCLLVSRSGLT